VDAVANSFEAWPMADVGYVGWCGLLGCKLHVSVPFWKYSAQ
jgi:hypothetical protein